jgi:hypothetical protein
MSYMSYMKIRKQLFYLAGLCKTDAVISAPEMIKLSNGKSLCEAKRKSLPQLP